VGQASAQRKQCGGASIYEHSCEEAGSNAAGRASASTNADEHQHRQLHQDSLSLSSLSHNLGVAKGTMFIINHEGIFKSVNTLITNARIDEAVLGLCSR
jgi:hypothetical protein